MKKRINGSITFLMSITMLFSACSKDPETKPITTDPEVKVGDILVYTYAYESRWTDRVRVGCS